MQDRLEIAFAEAHRALTIEQQSSKPPDRLCVAALTAVDPRAPPLVRPLRISSGSDAFLLHVVFCTLSCARCLVHVACCTAQASVCDWRHSPSSVVEVRPHRASSPASVLDELPWRGGSVAASAGAVYLNGVYGSPLCQNWAHPLPTSASGLGSTLSRPHWDWAHPCHICTVNRRRWAV
jgi:hypothetical protein